MSPMILCEKNEKSCFIKSDSNMRNLADLFNYPDATTPNDVEEYFQANENQLGDMINNLSNAERGNLFMRFDFFESPTLTKFIVENYHSYWTCTEKATMVCFHQLLLSGSSLWFYVREHSMTLCDPSTRSELFCKLFYSTKSYRSINYSFIEN